MLSSILLVAGGIFESCDEDKLTQINPNRAAADTFWQTAEDADKGIIGAYTPLTAITSYTRFRVFFTMYRSDAVNPRLVSGRSRPSFFQATPDLGELPWAWRDSYQGIYRTNEVIANVPAIEMDQSQKNSILGEAYFLRAFNYFDLLTNFRDIPLNLDPNYGVSDPLEVVQASQEVVWDQIISDLETAESLLPKSRSGKELGRATKASAQGYLGKAHLYKADLVESSEDYGKAITVFNRLLSENPELSLVADYNDNFRDETENNSESIFEIQFLDDGNGGWGTDGLGVRKSNNFTEDIAPKEPGNYSGQDSMSINQWVLDLFLDERTVNGELDPRVYSTIMFESNEETNYQGKVLKSTYFEGKNYVDAFGGSGLGVFGKKYLEVDKYARASFNSSNNNLRLLRLADIYLMLAEAELKNNGGNSTTAAVNAINVVRRRADMPEFDASLSMQDIMDERVKELTLEWSRYFDLLRWGIVKERIVDIPGIKSNAITTDLNEIYNKDREYMAIPQGELDLFPNLQPNPGY